MSGMGRETQKNDVIVDTEGDDFVTDMGCMPIKYKKSIFALESPSSLWLKAPGEISQNQSKSYTKEQYLGILLEPLQA